MSDSPKHAAPESGTASHGPAQEDRPLQPEDLPGIYLIAGGVLVAVLAPLFGFLGGSMVGTSGGGDSVDRLFLWLTGGLVLGGLGAIVAFLGGLKLVRSRRRDAGRR